MLTKTLSALTLVAGLTFSGLSFADGLGSAQAKPAATSKSTGGSKKGHGPKLKKVSKDSAQAPAAGAEAKPEAKPAQPRTPSRVKPHGKAVRPTKTPAVKNSPAPATPPSPAVAK